MFQIVAAYDQMNSEQKTAHLHKNGLNVVRTLVNLTVSISNEKVRKYIVPFKIQTLCLKIHIQYLFLAL